MNTDMAHQTIEELNEMMANEVDNDTSINSFRDLTLVTNDRDGSSWYVRTIMGGLIADNAIIDGRQEIGGETNPNFGKDNAFIPASGYIGVSNFTPLMDCDKVIMRVQLTTIQNALAGIAGVVGYDADKQPVTVFHIVENGDADTFGDIEFIRPSNVEYIRYHTLGQSWFLYNHIQLMYCIETIQKQLLEEQLLVRREVVLAKNTGDIGENATRLSDGSSINGNFDHAVMDVRGADYVTIRARIIDGNNPYVNYGGVILGGMLADGTREVLDIVYRIFKFITSTTIGYTHTITIKLPIGAEQIRWSIYNGTTQTTAYLYCSTGNLHERTLHDVSLGKSNKVYQYLEHIRQAKYISSGTSPTVLGLLHFSDFHEDIVAAKLINEYADTFGTMIDDVISTGDVVKTYLDAGSPNTYFNVNGLAERSLFVLGNHDQALQSKHDVYFWINGGGNFSTKAETVAASHMVSFQRYFEGYHAGWGVTMPSGYNDPTSPYYQACYWHKDYESQKIRLIGLDCMYRFDGILAKDGNGDFVTDGNGMLAIAANGDGMAKMTTEQETWLKNLLDETLDAQSNVYGYSVVCLAHYPLEDRPHNNTLDVNGCNNDYTNGGMVLNHRTHETVAFEYDISNGDGELEHRYNMRNRIAYNNSYGYQKGEVNNMGDILQHFKNNGGKLVAWICGHTHSDHFYYSKPYSDILIVVIDQAGALRNHPVTARSADMDIRMCANYYAIDTASGLFKIVRLGLTSDRFLRPKNTLCYDYINRKVISEG